jgi:hypothetical protein
MDGNYSWPGFVFNSNLTQIPELKRVVLIVAPKLFTMWGSQLAELNAQNSCAKVCLLPVVFAGQITVRESKLHCAMRKISTNQGCICALAVLLWISWFQPCLKAQQARKFSPKVMEVLNSPTLELKDDDSALLRLKKERFNAALKEAKARFDMYKRGLTRLPDLIEVGERLFRAEVDLYDKPEEKTQVLQRHLEIYNEAEANLEKQVKENLATQADLERLRYNKASVEIELLNTENSEARPGATPQPSPQ